MRSPVYEQQRVGDQNRPTDVFATTTRCSFQLPSDADTAMTGSDTVSMDETAQSLSVERVRTALRRVRSAFD